MNGLKEEERRRGDERVPNLLKMLENIDAVINSY